MVNTLIQNYDPHFAVVEYHVGDDGYHTVWGDDRGDFYNIWGDGIPWFAYDGLYDAWPIATYETKLQQRLADPTDVVMTVTGVEQTPDTWEITTEVCIEAGGSDRTMRVYMVQVLDALWVVDGHPNLPAYSRNTFKQAAATEDVAVVAGECAQVMRSFTFDADSMAQIEDVKIVAWAQEPAASIPAKAHQARVSPWPFIETAVFDDGFETGDTSGWTLTIP